jgi:hypothetical protein
VDQNARAAARARERNTNDTHTKTRTHASHTGGPSRCMLLQNNTASRYRERRGLVVYPTSTTSGAVGLSGGHGGPRGGALQCRVHGNFRCAAGRNGMRSRKSRSSAGSAPPSSAAARAAQPASVTWVFKRTSSLSFASTPVGSGGAPAGGGGGGATRGRRGPRRQTGCP